MKRDLPLMAAYPSLASVAREPLCELPTPIQAATGLEGALRRGGIYIKRDDLTHPEYGGNKIRKLEFLLGEALRRKKREVLTFGFAGSNFCLATALHAKSRGLDAISMLLPQANAPNLRANLKYQYKVGAELHLRGGTGRLGVATVHQLIRHFLKTGRWPMIIPAGGSSPAGVLGFVNAAYELKEQVEQGVMPVPDRIYVAMGSMGCAAGLVLGLKALRYPTRVQAVRDIVGRGSRGFAPKFRRGRPAT